MSRRLRKISPPVKVDRDGRLIKDHGKAHRWRLDVPASITGTQRKRLLFLSEADAKTEREAWLQLHGSLAQSLLRQLSQEGLTVEGAVISALENVSRISDCPLSDLIEKFFENRIHELKISDRYAATLKSQCANIRDVLGSRKIGELTRDDIRSFLSGLKGRPEHKAASTSTRNHYLETLRALFTFAKTEGLLRDSPTDGVSTAKPDREPIQVLSVEEVARLLAALRDPKHADVAPAMLLQLFAGLRRCELPFLEWSKITDKFVRLDRVKRGTKTRAVEMHPVLLDWLAPHRKEAGMVFSPAAAAANYSDPQAMRLASRKLEDAYASRLNLLGRAAGVELPKNVLRHTAITMKVNLTNDLPAVSRWAGNTPEVISSNYLGYATSDDATLFYALTPSKVSAGSSPDAAAERGVEIDPRALFGAESKAVG